MLQRIEELLGAPEEGASAPSLAHMEETLTDGYAQALALEAERARIERRIGEVAVAAEGRAGLAEELSTLAQRMRSADRELRSLRSRLRMLNDRTRSARRQTIPDLTA
jgi:predicted  nucleic acid-binding Zn-ribbon protein